MSGQSSRVSSLRVQLPDAPDECPWLTLLEPPSVGTHLLGMDRRRRDASTGLGEAMGLGPRRNEEERRCRRWKRTTRWEKRGALWLGFMAYALIVDALL